MKRTLSRGGGPSTSQGDQPGSVCSTFKGIKPNKKWQDNFRITISTSKE